MIKVFFRHFFIMKIYSIITIRFYFNFQKILIAFRFAIKFFLNMSADFMPDSIKLLKQVIIFNQKIHNFLHTWPFPEALYVMA